ncbi:uncharacterized protein SPSC_02260 [Sporisorium scitamineum]|uniref:Uncharacterized protein n=1 Tax=Sporisorium scitamineum TaxID=49012 RepID=A0A0F7RV03_9BASI|nr:hypothetical protein [Sporisorium scitamineum]CDU23631.1 uncharacterized protein SPSC_02260 [Sporisorium scitamineum]
MIVFTCSGGQVDSAAHAVFAFPLLDPFWQYASDIAAAWMPGFARVPHIRNLVEYVHGWPSTYQALQGLDKLRMQLVYTASLTALKETRLRMRIDFDLDQARARVLTEILSVRLSSTKLFDNTPFSSNQAASVDQIQNLVRIATETRIALA